MKHWREILGVLLAAATVSVTCHALAAELQAAAAVEVVPQVTLEIDTRNVRFSADGALLVVLDRAWVRLVDIATGRLIRSIEADGSAQFMQAATTLDGRNIVTLGDDGGMRFWDVVTGAERFAGESDRGFRDLEASAGPIELSPDGRRVGAANGAGEVLVVDLETGRRIDMSPGFEPASAPTVAFVMAFSPDLMRLATIDVYDDTATIWDAATGRKLRSIPCPNDYSSVAFSADGSYLVSADRALYACRIETGAVDTLMAADEISDTALQVSFAISGDRSAAIVNAYDFSSEGDENSRYFLLDLNGRTAPRALPFRTDQWEEVILSRDGGRFIKATVSSYEIWDSSNPLAGTSISSTGLVPPVLGYTDVTTQLSLGADGSLVVGHPDGAVHIWDLTSGAVTAGVDTVTSIHGYERLLGVLPASPDGTRMLIELNPTEVHIWNLVTGREAEINWHPRDRRGSPCADAPCVLAASVDGRTVAIRGADAALRLVDTGSLTMRSVVDLPAAPTNAAFSADGSTVAAATRDCTISIALAETGAVIGSFAFPAPPAPSGCWDRPTLQFTSDGSELRVFGLGPELFVWNLSTRQLSTERLDGYEIQDASRPEIGVLATDGTSALHLLGGKAGARSFDARMGQVVFARFLSDGERIVSMTNDRAVRVWDSASGALLLTLVSGSDPEDWLALTPAGFFNFGGDGMKLLAVIDGLTPYGVEQFYQALYRPDLVQELLRGDPQLLHADAASKLNMRSILESGPLPEIEIISAEQQGDSLKLVADVTDSGGGIGNVSISVRGEDAAKAEQRAFEPGRGAILTGPRSLRIEREIALEPCTKEPCRNIVSIVAFNGANLLASDPVEITLDAIGVTEGRRGRLHVLAIGIDDYAPGGVRPLNYAVTDANKVAEALERVGANLYDGVEVTTLLNADVTMEALDRTFTELGERIEPHDKFVFYVSGHGTTRAGRYYFFPQDFTYDEGGTIETGAISQEQWSVWFGRIKARASLFLYDTCEAGTVADGNVQRGEAEVEGALNRLINALGRNVIAASSGEQAAYEGYNGHGLFTWTLLEAFAGGDADANAMIEVTELQTYIENRVPFLSREHFGIVQEPRYDIRANFPVGAMVAEVAPVAGIPSAPTHVVLIATDVLDEEGAVVGRLEPGKTVRVIDAASESTLVARQGVVLGRVANGSIATLD